MAKKWLKISFSVKIYLIIILVGIFSCKKKSNIDFAKVTAQDVTVKGFCKVSGFGSNPGNLEMYRYVPQKLDTNPALVIALHGCTQDAEELLHDTEWDKLAEKYGFVLLLPETKRVNNMQKCYNWFDVDDQKREGGEPASIMQMADVMIKNHGISSKKVFVTGLSAGGAMATILMATYPDVFKAGAVMAGGAYKAAENVWQAQKAMNGKVSKTPEEWGNLAKDASQFSGQYPKLVVFQGEDDKTVDPKNAEELIKQWCNLHQAVAVNYISTPYFASNKNVKEYDYVNTSGQTVVKYYAINGLGHQLAVDPGSANGQGGKENKYSIDTDFYAPYWAAVYFGLIP